MENLTLALPDWAIDPIKSCRERNQSNRVVVFATVECEATIQPRRLQLFEQFGECDGVFIKAEIIFAAY
jgi:hypothetical protein